MIKENCWASYLMPWIKEIRGLKPAYMDIKLSLAFKTDSIAYLVPPLPLPTYARNIEGQIKPWE